MEVIVSVAVVCTSVVLVVVTVFQYLYKIKAIEVEKELVLAGCEQVAVQYPEFDSDTQKEFTASKFVWRKK